MKSLANRHVSLISLIFRVLHKVFMKRNLAIYDLLTIVFVPRTLSFDKEVLN